MCGDKGDACIAAGCSWTSGSIWGGTCSRPTKRRAREEKVLAEDLIFVAYQCDPGTCLDNNTCDAGRTGLACGQWFV